MPDPAAFFSRFENYALLDARLTITQEHKKLVAKHKYKTSLSDEVVPNIKTAFFSFAKLEDAHIDSLEARTPRPCAFSYMFKSPRARSLTALLLSSCLALGCSASAGADGPAATEGDIVLKNPEFRNYAQSEAWTSSCEGPSVTQADLNAMLGDRSDRALGRFQVATRDLCSPWVNGTRSCGPSGESREASTGAATFAFGLNPNHVPSMAAWRFFRGPLLVHDGGTVLARRVGAHVVVQLVGDVSTVEVGTQREWDGRVTGSARLQGRLLSSDLVRDDGSVRGMIRVATDRDSSKIDVADIDVETLRWTEPPTPLANLARAKRVYGLDSWSDPSMWSLQGNMTQSCLRLTDGMKPTGTVVTATFGAKTP